MFTRKITGTLVAASLTAGALMTMPSASAAPTWTHIQNIGVSGNLPKQAVSAVADNGDTVVAWVRGDRVMAASAEHGEFGPAYYVSSDTDEASKPSVAINNAGDAVVTWVQDDNLGHARLAGNRRNADGSFTSGHNYLSPPVDQDVEGQAPSLALAENGTARVAYQSTDGAAVHQIRVASWVEGANTATTSTLSDSTAKYPAIDVNKAGTVQVAWYDVQGAQAQIKTRRLAAGLNFWSLASNASPVGTFGGTVDVALSDTGNGTVGMLRKFGDVYRIQATKLSSTGTVGTATYVTPEDASVGDFDLDQNNANTALLAWTQAKLGELRVGYSTRTETGSWTGSVFAKAIDVPTGPIAGISDSGSMFVGYTGNERMIAAYKAKSILPWELYNSGDINVDDPSTMGGIDDQGNIFLGSVVFEADPTQGHGVARFLDIAGPKAWLTKPTLNTVGTDPLVAWSAGDRLSELANSDVKVRAAAWNGNFNAVEYAAADFGGTEFSYEGKGGRTYCFSARTGDAVGNYGAFSAEKCTTTALDDGALTVTNGFKRVDSANGYNGGYSVATTKGSTLRLTGVKASRLALLVSKVGTGGTVEVYFHGDKLGSYSLAGSGNKVVVPVATLDSVETGTVVIKVISANGKTVRIDGLFAAK
jgi:hypothetical protein